MEDERYTATQIAELLCDALEVTHDAQNNLHFRVKYLAKKAHLRGGRKTDARGTLDFPKSEVFRAVLFNEFLGLSMDIAAAAKALDQAEDFHPMGQHPQSARAPGGSGWNYRGGLASAVRGVAAGELWHLVLTLQRSGHSSNAGLRAQYTWSDENVEEADRVLGRKAAATTVTVNLRLLFEDLIERVGVI